MAERPPRQFDPFSRQPAQKPAEPPTYAGPTRKLVPTRSLYDPLELPTFQPKGEKADAADRRSNPLSPRYTP